MALQKYQGPSRFSLKLIRWLCQTDLAEEIEGNLIEYHERNHRSKVRFRVLRYWFEFFNYLRPSTLKKVSLSKYNNMFNFNPLFTIRSLFKQGSSAVINILGFSLGLVCVLFLYFHVKSELSYDQFHEDKDIIYRALRVADQETNPRMVGVTSGPFGPNLKNDFPNSIQSYTRVQSADVLASFEDQSFIEEEIILADSNFFSFFSFPLLEGSPESVLKELNSAVLGKETARKYFGDEDPIGKIIKIDNEMDFVVRGIMDEFPGKSHFDFTIVLNINLMNLDSWWNNGLITYLKIATPQEAQYVDAQLNDFMVKHFGEDFASIGVKLGLTLESLNDTYLNDNTSFDSVKHGDLNTIYILGAVGLAILLIACFNYVNLAIAQSFKRAKEIAVRKVLGGHKLRLIFQFLGESLTILLAATLIAILLALIITPLFNSYFGLNIEIDWQDANLLIFSGLILGTTLLIAGLYPAMLLSSFHPLTVFKKGKSGMGKNTIIRKSLVIIQFTISVFMIAVTLLIGRQLDFVQSADLGFDQEAIVMVEINNQQILSNQEGYKNSFANDPNIISFSAVGGEPGGFHDVTTIDIQGIPQGQKVRIGWGDEDYFETFGIEILHGRSFSQNLKSDSAQTVILNKKALEEIGISPEEALEARINIQAWGLSNLRVVGITDNYKFTSLKQQMEPLIMVNGLNPRRFAVKINAANISAALASIENSWKQFSPVYPIEYEFMDNSIAQLYENETKQGKVFSAFATVSVFLACMGVFGLATHTARQRQKELGIRKVLGASVSQIINLLSKEFVFLVGVACILALPASWYFTSNWLMDFQYQIDLLNNWALFLISGVAVGLVAFVTIGFKTYRAAVSNPTESIRYE